MSNSQLDLTGFEKITVQSIFDKAWQAFIIENKPPSSKGNSNCYYKLERSGEVARHCAIGLSLPSDHEIFKQHNTEDFVSIIKLYPELFSEELVVKANSHNEDVNYLSCIQTSLHDGLCTYTGDKWQYTLAERTVKYINFAIKYKLTIPNTEMITLPLLSMEESI